MHCSRRSRACFAIAYGDRETGAQNPLGWSERDTYLVVIGSDRSERAKGVIAHGSSPKPNECLATLRASATARWRCHMT